MSIRAALSPEADLIDDEPFDGDEAIAQAGDPAAVDNQLNEIAAFERARRGGDENAEIERPTEVSRFQRRAPAADVPVVDPVAEPVAPVVQAPAAQTAIERLAETLLRREEREAAIAAQRNAPPPPQSLVDQFDDVKNNAFYERAMRAAGLTPNEQGLFTKAEAMAVRAELKARDLEEKFERHAQSFEQRQQAATTQGIVEQAQRALSQYEPLTQRQEMMVGIAIKAGLEQGLHPQQAIEQALKESAGMLRPRATAQRPVPQNRSIRRADNVIATPQRSAPARTAEDRYSRLENARAGLRRPQQ